MKLKRSMVILICLAVVSAGGLGACGQSAPQSTPTQSSGTETNTRVVDIDADTVSAEGQIVPLRHTELAFETSGQVAEILVSEWETVEMDQPLVRLEAADLEAALTQAETAVQQAEAALSAAEVSVENAELGVQVAELGVRAAEAELALTASEPLTQEIASQQSNIDVTQAQVNQAAADRDVALAGPTEAEIRAAEAEVAAAAVEEKRLQDQYDELIKAGVGGAPEEQTRLALYAAEVSLSAAQAALDELKAGPSDLQQRAANASVSVAVAQRSSARAQLDLLLAGPKPEQIALTQVSVEQAQMAVEQAQAAVAEAEAAKAQAEVSVAEARAARDAAQVALDAVILRAPFAGTVARLNVELGNVVSPGAPVLTLVDMGGWLVRTTDLTELNVVAVSTGASATVTVDAIPGETLTGRVTDISAVSGENRGDVTYEVTIALDEVSDLPLRWGMTAFVTIDVGD